MPALVQMLLVLVALLLQSHRDAAAATAAAHETSSAAHTGWHRPLAGEGERNWEYATLEARDQAVACSFTRVAAAELTAATFQQSFRQKLPVRTDLSVGGEILSQLCCMFK